MPKISILSRFTDLVAPRCCPVCGTRLGTIEEHICAVCDLRLPRTCHRDNPADNAMTRLFYGKIPVERCAALAFYESQSQANNLIYRLKYSRRPDIGQSLGGLLAKELAPCGFFDGIDVIVPVPLARVRERRRGYNQSLEIARGLSRATGLPIENKAVRRLSFGGSQTRMGFRERMENVENAFALSRPGRVAGRHILIVDDVVTTGATVTACARQLLTAGDVRISVAAVAFTRN